MESTFGFWGGFEIEFVDLLGFTGGLEGTLFGSDDFLFFCNIGYLGS